MSETYSVDMNNDFPVSRKDIFLTWADVHDGAGNYGGDAGGFFSYAYAASDSGANTWEQLIRGALCFNTSALTGIVSSGKIRIKTVAKYDDAGVTPSLGLVGYTGGITYNVAHYDKFGTTLMAPYVAYADYTVGDWIEIPLNAAGLANINAGGYTKFGLRTSFDINNAQPTWASHKSYGFSFQYRSSGSADGPQLVLEVTTLTVETDPATNISSTSATLNGTLTAGGDDVTCGFLAGLTSACSDWSGGAQNVDSPNSFDAQFDAVAAGIPPGSTVYFKAYATLGANTVYGEVLSFVLATYPTLGTARVSGLVHRWQQGKYILDIDLGGLSSGHGMTIPGVRYPNSIPPAVMERGTLTRQTYESWVRNTDIDVIIQLFGHFPTFEEWMAWYVATAASWGY